MEQTPNTFAAAQHKQRRRRRVRNACIAGAAALAVVIAAAVLIPALTAGGEDASVLTYQAAAVTEEVSLMAVPAKRPKPSLERPSTPPRVGKIRAAMTLSRKITEMAWAISSSSASVRLGASRKSPSRR